jgi:hypothetical protein
MKSVPAYADPDFKYDERTQSYHRIGGFVGRTDTYSDPKCALCKPPQQLEFITWPYDPWSRA